MAPSDSTRMREVVRGPARSRNAARAHAAAAVTWTIDLAQPAAERTLARANESRKRALVGLALVAGGLWSFDVGYLLAHLRSALG